MRSLGRPALVPLTFILLAAFATSCGFDALLFTPRAFEPTDAPRAVISGGALAGATVTVINVSGRVVAEGNASSSGTFELTLPAEEAGANLRLLAVAGGVALKAVIPSAPPGALVALGQLNARSTAIAQLATYEVQEEAGSSFRSTPPTALAALLENLGSQPTAALDAFAAVVDRLRSESGPAPFVIDTARLDVSFEAADAARAAEYRAAIAAAAAGYGLQIRCDPSRLAVMFTVDMSGRGRDGNGAPQLIRQPTKEGRVFLGFTSDESSAVADDTIPPKLTPNDPRYSMTDDGQNGDEEAGDGIYTVVVPLPRGARVQYKYTNGAAGEGFTQAEEWPGNARILEVQDVLTGRPDGEPDCLVIRRDSFGDEASNKNFVNANAVARTRGGTVSFDTDLGGAQLPVSSRGVVVGGLLAEELRSAPPLTPAGIPEARENGVCTSCPAPLVLDPDDAVPPQLLGAERLAIDRVRVRFSEPLVSEDAAEPRRFLYLDDAGRAVPIVSARASGADVILILEPTHPRAPASLRVNAVRDASVRANILEEAEVPVAPDRTPPRILSARALSILEVDPSVVPADPTVGDLVELVLDETPEESAASDPQRFVIEGLNVLAAAIVSSPGGPSRVRLVTEVQAKGLRYSLRVMQLRDPAGNALEQEVSFEGFALHRVKFSVVPGFAFADSAGQAFGMPRGEKLYLTGTPLSRARALDGTDLSIVGQGSTRTDVTGWPAFELRPSARTHEGRAVHELEVLLPKGSWAWKAAHGVEGEYVRAPVTLEKVYKTLVTTNDATGVRVDPTTLIAANGESYAGARLSENGDEPPRRNVVFKREAPDEVCEVHRDVECPLIVVGAWRDLALDPGGQTRDYDDGLIALPPHRPTLPDVTPPRLLDARARDSYSVLLSFDEALTEPTTTLEVGLTRAEDGYGVRSRLLMTSEVKPHQAVVLLDANGCEGALTAGAAYTVRYRGARNLEGLGDRTWRTQTILAPEVCTPLTPLTDRTPPRVSRVVATDLTELAVSFDERLDPATLSLASFSAAHAGNGAALEVRGFAFQPDRASVRLTTAQQQILEPYRLTVSGVADAADPPNVLTSSTVSFVGFGERVPPTVLRARAIANDRVLVRFDEPVDPSSALDASHYAIAGLTVREVQFSGDPGRRALAFNPALAPRIRDTVLLGVSGMVPGAPYAVAVSGVLDLSGNRAEASASFEGVSDVPQVMVVLEYEVSDSRRVGGSVPSRAISLATLSNSREGVFVLGARATMDHAPAAGRAPPVNDVLGGFGVEGQPLDGIEPRLLDNGVAPDRVAGDGVFTLGIPNVPLGTTLIWKAFAPFNTTYRDQNPSDPSAAFADPLPGPSVFADGQEFPGNENGAVVLDDGTSDGEVRIRALFGDEITFKKHTGGPAYVWVSDDR